MCYINIYAVTRNQVSLLIKAEVFDFFSLICYNVKRAKIQTMARKHTLGSSSESGSCNVVVPNLFSVMDPFRNYAKTCGPL